MSLPYYRCDSLQAIWMPVVWVNSTFTSMHMSTRHYYAHGTKKLIMRGVIPFPRAGHIIMLQVLNKANCMQIDKMQCAANTVPVNKKLKYRTAAVPY